MATLNPFNYERPASLEELTATLRRSGGTAIAFLAGGTDLLVDIRTGKKAPALVIDLKGLPGMAAIDATAHDKITVGALAPIHSLELDPAVTEDATALYEGAQNLGSWQVRNRATLGGNLANAAPTADTAAPLLALDAEILTWSPAGQRRIPAAAFWLGAGKPALGEGEIVAAIDFPRKANTASAFVKHGPRKAMDIAIASAAAVLTIDGGVIREARIALGGAAAVPIRARAAEDFLAGKPASDENLAAAGALAVKESNPRSSHRASREYRLSIIPVLVERALKAARDRHQAAQNGKGGNA